MKLGFKQWEDRFIAEQTLGKREARRRVGRQPARRGPACRCWWRSGSSPSRWRAARRPRRRPSEAIITSSSTTSPRRSRTQTAIPAKPSRIGILWDASLSRGEADKTRELALLKKLLANMDPNGVVDMVAFRNEPTPRELPDQRRRRRDRASTSRASSTTAARTSRNSPLAASRSTWSASTTAQRSRRLRLLAAVHRWPGQPRPGDAGEDSRRPVYPISNDARSNHALLKRHRRRQRRRLFQPRTRRPTTGDAGLSQSPYSLISVECNPAEVADVYPHGSQPVLGRVTVTGRLLAPEAKITLNYGFGGSVVASQEFTLTQKGATANRPRPALLGAAEGRGVEQRCGSEQRRPGRRRPRVQSRHAEHVIAGARNRRAVSAVQDRPAEDERRFTPSS